MAEQTEAERLAVANELLIGAVENGPWVLIPDPQLRQIVGEYVADTCHAVAAAAGLDEAMERAHDVMPQRLAQSLPGVRVAPDARERLARHLFLLAAKTDQWREMFIATWDGAEIDRAPWLGQADDLLAVIAGKEG